MRNVKFEINARSEGSSKTIISARKFKVAVDEPPEAGGDDLGANPIEYMFAALAGCLNVVGNIVAREWGFKIYQMGIVIGGALNPAKFAGHRSPDRLGRQSVEGEV